ncbi:GNAT family N-acetyltransferase [Microbacterium istanbulense]|uniref:GNAT family N-acetyltransferase n=1 Tax=Microbacterium istanbulense TaxID=3122049 RepID=A0ABU8LI39_9MICO
MTGVELQVVEDAAVGASVLERIGALFDAEYQAEHGPWERRAPYGYAPADIRVLAFDGTGLIGHVGYQRRTVGVGDREVTVAGVGGVLVAPRARGLGLGIAMLRRAQGRMASDVDYGYLGCRPAVVPFYEAAGWRRIRAREHSLSPATGSPVTTNTDPILICDAGRPASEWPAGTIDLRGLPW